MRNPFGSVFQPTYRYKGETRKTRTWWIRYTANGRRIKEATNATTRRQALECLKVRVTSATQPRGRGFRFTDLVRLGEEDYAHRKRKSTGFLMICVRRLEPFFGLLTAGEITDQHLRDYQRKQLRADYAHSTVNRDLSVLRRLLNLARRHGVIDTLPQFHMLAEDNVRKGFFEAADLVAILAHLPDHYRPLVKVAYVTGWRFWSELATRQWRHVDFSAEGGLRLDPGETKNKEGRFFPLIAPLRSVLTAQRQATDQAERRTGKLIPWVFHRDGSPFGRGGTFTQSWRRACESAKVAGRVPHDFRRTAVRNFEIAGTPRPAAMAMVGHKTEAIYRRYAIADMKMVVMGGQRLEAHLADVIA